MSIKKTNKGWVYQGITFETKKEAEKVKKNDEEKMSSWLNKSDFEKGKQRVNMWLDIDLLDQIKIKAEVQGIGYQTLINKYLRDIIFNEKSTKVIDLKTSELKKLIKDVLRSA